MAKRASQIKVMETVETGFMSTPIIDENNENNYDNEMNIINTMNNNNENINIMDTIDINNDNNNDNNSDNNDETNNNDSNINNSTNEPEIHVRKGSAAAIVYSAVEIDENFYDNPAQSRAITQETIYETRDVDINDPDNVYNDNDDDDDDSSFDVGETFLDRMRKERRASIDKLNKHNLSRPTPKELEQKGIINPGDMDRDYGQELQDTLKTQKINNNNTGNINDIHKKSDSQEQSNNNNKKRHRKAGSIIGDFDLATQNLWDDYERHKIEAKNNDDYKSLCQEQDRIITQLREEIQNLKRKLYKHRKKSSVALGKITDLAKKAEIASRENELRITRTDEYGNNSNDTNNNINNSNNNNSNNSNDDSNNIGPYTERDVEDAMGELIVQQIAAAIALFNMEFEKEFGKIDWENEDWDPNNTFDEEWANFNSVGNPNTGTIEWTPATFEPQNNDDNINNNDNNDATQQTKRRKSREDLLINDDNNDDNSGNTAGANNTETPNDEEKNLNDTDTPQGPPNDVNEAVEDAEILKRLRQSEESNDTIHIRRNSKVLEYNINTSNSNDVFEFKYDENTGDDASKLLAGNGTTDDGSGGAGVGNRLSHNNETPGGPTPGGPDMNDENIGYGFTPGGPDDYIDDDGNIEELFMNNGNGNSGINTKDDEQQKEIERLIDMNTNQANEINELRHINNELKKENKQKLINMDSKIQELSQKIFKFSDEINQLKEQNILLEQSKMSLIESTSVAMNEYRKTIRQLNQQNRQFFAK